MSRSPTTVGPGSLANTTPSSDQAPQVVIQDGLNLLIWKGAFTNNWLNIFTSDIPVFRTPDASTIRRRDFDPAFLPLTNSSPGAAATAISGPWLQPGVAPVMPPGWFPREPSRRLCLTNSG